MVQQSMTADVFRVEKFSVAAKNAMPGMVMQLAAPD